LRHTLGRIALTANDIGAIIDGEYFRSLEPQLRVNIRVPSMALIAVLDAFAKIDVQSFELTGATA
jgi:hypothetical protein